MKVKHYPDIIKKINHTSNSKEWTLWKRDYFVLCFLFGLAMFFLITEKKFESDFDFWRRWTGHIFNEGLMNAYKSGTDYVPVYLYLLKIFTLFFDSIEKMNRNIYYLKIMTLPFHFVSGYYLLSLIKDYVPSERMILYAVLYVLNISVLYNTLLWGQVDEIETCFLIMGAYYMYKQQYILGWIWYLMAINFKLQAIVFFPIFGILTIPFLRILSVRDTIRWVLTIGIVQLLILLPFIIAGDFHLIMNNIQSAVGRYPHISLNAYNFWHIVLNSRHFWDSDTTTFLGISYKMIGLFMFCFFSFFALYPLLIRTWKQEVLGKNYLLTILLVCALIPLVFFFFNTQMHERYSHPFIVFVVGYSIISKRYFPAILGSAAYLLNLDAVMRSIPFQKYSVVLFDTKFIAWLFAITIVYLYYDLYRINKDQGR